MRYITVYNIASEYITEEEIEENGEIGDPGPIGMKREMGGPDRCLGGGLRDRISNIPLQVIYMIKNVEDLTEYLKIRL